MNCVAGCCPWYTTRSTLPCRMTVSLNRAAFAGLSQDQVTDYAESAVTVPFVTGLGGGQGSTASAMSPKYPQARLKFRQS